MNIRRLEIILRTQQKKGSISLIIHPWELLKLSYINHLEVMCAGESYFLEEKNNEWVTYYVERGRKSDLKKFDTESDACKYFYNWMLLRLDTNNFFFLEKEEYPSPQEALIVDIPSITSENELFNELAKKLPFPDDFKYDWNSTVDCLQREKTIKQNLIVIRHESLNLDSEEMHSYLFNFRSAIIFCEYWNQFTHHYHNDLIVFPLSQKAEIFKIMKAVNKELAPLEKKISKQLEISKINRIKRQEQERSEAVLFGKAYLIKDELHPNYEVTKYVHPITGSSFKIYHEMKKKKFF